jgi:hypothetical protein
MGAYVLTETVIFNASTAQVTTQVELDLRTENTQAPVTIMANNLAGAEKIYIWFSCDGGDTWEEYMTDGSQLTLTANDNIRACYSGVYLGFTKDATASAVTCIANVMSRASRS